jgi:hypothetical protein
MSQVAIGVGTDELAPEGFISEWRNGGKRRFRRRSHGISALKAEFGVFLILLLALRTGFHPPESITMAAPSG